MTDESSRVRLEQKVALLHPLAVLAGRITCEQLEAVLGPSFLRRKGADRVVAVAGLFGRTLRTVGGSLRAAGQPRLPIRPVAPRLYLKNTFNLSDEVNPRRVARRQLHLNPRDASYAYRVAQTKRRLGK
ncbi:hypothetical protein [Methylotetracoccus oryzae]|uniref:hypothetical protein n=1 Tax=Methylotetracoccus oryzae TaxID=1919059 RepID=UPI001118C801|nr:hypothetical protein [Methylotetracoccus oryzae]